MKIKSRRRKSVNRRDDGSLSYKKLKKMNSIAVAKNATNGKSQFLKSRETWKKIETYTNNKKSIAQK